MRISWSLSIATLYSTVQPPTDIATTLLSVMTQLHVRVHTYHRADRIESRTERKKLFRVHPTVYGALLYAHPPLPLTLVYAITYIRDRYRFCVYLRSYVRIPALPTYRMLCCMYVYLHRTRKEKEESKDTRRIEEEEHHITRWGSFKRRKKERGWSG